MTDKQLTKREILEACARACQKATANWNDGLEPYSSGEGFIQPNNSIWNPYDDDGDCFRMANKCGVTVNCLLGEARIAMEQVEHFTPGNDAECRRAVCMVVARSQIAKEQGA